MESSMGVNLYFPIQGSCPINLGARRAVVYHPIRHRKTCRCPAGLSADQKEDQQTRCPQTHKIQELKGTNTKFNSPIIIIITIRTQPNPTQQHENETCRMNTEKHSNNRTLLLKCPGTVVHQFMGDSRRTRHALTAS